MAKEDIKKFLSSYQVCAQNFVSSTMGLKGRSWSTFQREVKMGDNFKNVNVKRIIYKQFA